MRSRIHSSRGYILVEAVMAMAMLSVGSLAIQGALRQAVMTRGIAQDYTEARFLLERILAMVEIQPMLTQDSGEGVFEPPYERFSWKYEISKIDLPEPPIPANIPEEELEKFKLQVRYVTKIVATVSWSRRDREFEETVETLWVPEKLFVPEDELP